MGVPFKYKKTTTSKARPKTADTTRSDSVRYSKVLTKPASPIGFAVNKTPRGNKLGFGTKKLLGG